MAYKNNIVEKPWGYEYLAYENEAVAIWFLYLANQQRTSMHCHPNKTTGLMVLSGSAQVSFLDNTLAVAPGGKVMIRKGMFHSSCATNDLGTWLMEIETPVNKHDLVRFRDSYGREGQPYEDKTHEIPKLDDCIWIKEPPSGSTKIYNLDAETQIEIRSTTDTRFFRQLSDEQNIVFLRGGIKTDYDINVASPGDIVSARIIKKLLDVFTNIDEKTVIMMMGKR
tara:strand:- start:8267 stop:8938 length:672 start_codon:yes stop_codon:yes gene_type:complete